MTGWRVETGDLTCARCGGRLLLMLQVPYEHPDGFRAVRKVPLCQFDDREDPAVGALLLFFAVHKDVDLGNVEEFSVLVDHWLDRLPPPQPGTTPEALDAQIEAWRRGEYDADA